MANNKSIFQKISNFFEPSKQNIIQDTVEKSIISDPGLPPAPISQKEKGRNWDYPSQSNAVRSPEKSRYEALRIIADACSLVRLAIETRKDQISRFKWKIVLKNKATKTTNRKTIELEAFFQSPDKDQKFHEWLRPIIEDMFVIDAVAIYPRKTLGGQLYSLETIDAATITKIIDSTGRTPTDEEAIAYIQEIKGLPISSYTTKELIYKNRNKSTNKLYGKSVVEQLEPIINIAIRKQVNQLEYFTEGNLPNSVLEAGDPEWRSEEINEFLQYFNQETVGASKHKAKMVPSGVKFHDTKPNIGKDSLDDYITRMICYGFNLTPSALVADNNRATSETLSTLAKEDGLAPLLDWVKNLIDSIIVKQFGYDDVEFLWNIEEEQDPLTSSQIDVSLVNAGILTINEVRSSRGLDPLDEPKPDSANDNTNKVYFEKKAFNDGY